jgi:hypothetical protein
MEQRVLAVLRASEQFSVTHRNVLIRNQANFWFRTLATTQTDEFEKIYRSAAEPKRLELSAVI